VLTAGDELVEMFLPMIRADVALSETYEHRRRPLLGCPISVFGGLSDREVADQGLEAWREDSRCEVVVRKVPGDHFFLESGRSILVRAIRKDLGATRTCPS
jgi:medium-chain acyl-[acyl-carrier-protein] hydrolase